MENNEINSSVQVKINCNLCGSNDLEIPDDATDESMVTCKGCNKEICKWGELKESAMNAAKDEATNILRNAMKEAFEGNSVFKFE